MIAVARRVKVSADRRGVVCARTLKIIERPSDGSVPNALRLDLMGRIVLDFLIK